MKKILDAVEKHREMILSAERYIWQHPETGYKEYKTSAYMAEKFRALGYEITEAEGITGFYTVVDTGREGPEVLVLGELDSIICPEHKDADPVTGAVHSCGHNAQCAALLGIAAALKEPGVLDGMSGRIRLCAVPAEELLEIGYRTEQKKAGRIKYYGGKSEFLSRGYFDGVDLALMVHTSSGFTVLGGSVGCIAKSIIYKGVAAHAGGDPENGVNALYAANCGLNAINALRETFTDSSHIRVHPIITHGGDMVNAIPANVTLESYVRGATVEAIARENKKVNRALCGAALSLGANVEIVDIPGYAPLKNDAGMIGVAADAIAMLYPDVKFNSYPNEISTGSTDMGDLSCIMPVVHPYCGGKIGQGHGKDYEIADPNAACIMSAAWQVGMLHLLLSDGAERARAILRDFKPTFASKEEFLAYQDAQNSSGDRIIYTDGKAEVTL